MTNNDEICITSLLSILLAVKPNEWYSYLTEKRTSTVALLVNLIIAITLVDVIKNLHTFIFFLAYIYNFSKF